ncbi:hypothetical protein GCM10010271_72010 [Streptomyces kurssanovii]|nr:hypothetical protein GCM10010271_72010 [Streptomyces kurssanovii]
MLEFVGRVEDGLPELEVMAHAWLLGPAVAGIVYVHPLTVHLVDEDGTLSVTDVLLERGRELGWVSTSDLAGWAERCPGWHTTLTGDQLLVRQPDGRHWYDGTLPASPEWRTAAQESGKVFHFTASRGGPEDVITMISSGQALAVVSTFG